MKHKLFSLITAFPLLLSVILAGFTPAQATPSNSNQDYILSGKIFLDGKLATLDSESLEWFSIGAGEQGSISKADGTYSIKVPVDVKLISFCYTTKGDLPYNTNSSHCSYLDSSLITIKTGDSPLTYSYDFYFNTTPGRMITGSITSPEKKVNGSYLTTYVKVYGEQGILESMNVFGNKYQISIPQIAKRITFCKAGMVCIELNPKSALFNSNNALLSFNLNFKKAATSTPVIVTSDTANSNTKTIDIFIWQKTKNDISKNKYYVYTINSRYNSALGCVNLHASTLTPETNEVPQDGYLCNQSNLAATSSDIDPSNAYKGLLSTRDAIAVSRQTKYVGKEFNIKVKIDNFTTALAICDDNECFHYPLPSKFERSKKELNGRDGNILIELPKFKNSLEIKDPNLSDSKFIFSKFSDGQKDLPNFISEIDTIKYISANNITLLEFKPRLSPFFMPNFYLSNVPTLSTKIEVCTLYNYCFTTRIEESITKYLEEKKPGKTFPLNITNTNLANYKKLGIIAENPNFMSNNFDKTLTIRYNTIVSDYYNGNRVRMGTFNTQSQLNYKISKDYLQPRICDDAQCAPAQLLPSSSCPNNPEICLSAKFTPFKKYNIMHAKLIHSDGSPAPYAAIQFPSNSSAMLKRILSTKHAEEFMDEVYPNLPEYAKFRTYYADGNGIVTFSLDLDHYYNKPQRCNMEVCSADYDYIFEQSSFTLATKETPLFITVPTEKYTMGNPNVDPYWQRDQKDSKITMLKPGMKISGQVIVVVYHPTITQPSDNPRKFLSPGAYLQTYDSKGNVIMKTETSAEGKFSLTLPSNFSKLEVCSGENQCQVESTLKNIYYISTNLCCTNLSLYRSSPPKDKIGMLNGIVYENSENKKVTNNKVYLFNDKNKLVGTLQPNSKGEFSKNLNYILNNKVTRMQPCPKFGGCDGYYNEIRLDEVQAFIDEQINYPFQVVSFTSEFHNQWFPKLAFGLYLLGFFFV